MGKIQAKHPGDCTPRGKVNLLGIIPSLNSLAQSCVLFHPDHFKFVIFWQPRSKTYLLQVKEQDTKLLQGGREYV